MSLFLEKLTKTPYFLPAKEKGIYEMIPSYYHNRNQEIGVFLIEPENDSDSWTMRFDFERGADKQYVDAIISNPDFLKSVFAHIAELTNIYFDNKSSINVISNAYSSQIGEVEVIDFDTAHDEFEDIPFNEDDEIEQRFYSFEEGTNRFEIFHWFENSFNLSLGEYFNL